MTPVSVTPPLSIRRAKPEDAEALLELFLRMEGKFDLLYEPGERPNDPGPVRALIGDFSQRPNCLYLVAEDGGEILGWLSLEGGRQRRRARAGYLIISVREDCQGRGVGTALLRAALTWAPAAGLIRVELGVLETNPRARLLYERMGFETEGCLRQFVVIRGQPITAMLMAKLFPLPGSHRMSAVHQAPSGAIGRSELTRRSPLILGAMLGNGVAQLPFFTAGAFMIPLQRSLGWSRTDLSLGLAASTLAVAAGGPFAGRLADRYGTRPVASFSLLAMALGFLGMSALSGAAWHYILAMGITALLGAGAAPITFTRVVNAAFQRDRGTALGLTLAGIGVGGTLGPSLAQAMVGTHGWRIAYLGIAAVLGTSAVLVALLVKDVDRQLSDETGQAHSDAPRDQTPWLRRRAIWMVGVGFFLAALALSGPVVHFIPILIDAGQRATQAAKTAGAIGIAVVVGSLLAGWLLDRFPAPRVTAAVFVLTAVGCLLLGLEGRRADWASALLFGFALGAVVDLLSYITARYFGVANYGVIFGVLYAVFSLAAGIGPVLMGWVDDRFGSYTPALMGSAVAAGLACLAIAWLGPYPEAMT